MKESKETDPHLYLLNALDAEPGSMLYRAATVLTRIEDLSHILIWFALFALPLLSPRNLALVSRSTSKPTGISADCNISLIELPRLKLKFQPRVEPSVKKDSPMRIRLYSVDHAGLYLSDFRDDQLNKLMTAIPHSIVMENASRELFLLVPNISITRPFLARCPFRSAFLFLFFLIFLIFPSDLLSLLLALNWFSIAKMLIGCRSCRRVITCILSTSHTPFCCPQRKTLLRT
jgi:hypothetical protein